MSKVVRFSLKDDENKPFSFSVNDPAPEMEEEGADVIAQAVVDQMIEDQPFGRIITECTKVEIIERTVKKIL